MHATMQMGPKRMSHLTSQRSRDQTQKTSSGRRWSFRVLLCPTSRNAAHYPWCAGLSVLGLELALQQGQRSWGRNSALMRGIRFAGLDMIRHRRSNDLRFSNPSADAHTAVALRRRLGTPLAYGGRAPPSGSARTAQPSRQAAETWSRAETRSCAPATRSEQSSITASHACCKIRPPRA